MRTGRAASCALNRNGVLLNAPTRAAITQPSGKSISELSHAVTYTLVSCAGSLPNLHTCRASFRQPAAAMSDQEAMLEAEVEGQDADDIDPPFESDHDEDLDLTQALSDLPRAAVRKGKEFEGVLTENAVPIAAAVAGGVFGLAVLRAIYRRCTGGRRKSKANRRESVDARASARVSPSKCVPQILCLRVCSSPMAVCSISAR